MYCGAAITDASISQEAKDRMQEHMQQEASKQAISNAGTSAKAFGAMLIIIGILADVISMFLIFSGGVSAFSVITIGGTIAFLIGLAIVSNS